MASGRTFDPKCFELAEHFLSDHPALNTEAGKITLAQSVQVAIEEEIAWMETVMAKLAVRA